MKLSTEIGMAGIQTQNLVVWNAAELRQQHWRMSEFPRMFVVNANSTGVNSNYNMMKIKAYHIPSKRKHNWILLTEPLFHVPDNVKFLKHNKW